MSQINYSRPQVCTWELNIKKAWFVYFDMANLQTGEVVRKQYRGGINYFKTVDERLEYAEKYRQFWEKKLKDGWDLFADQTPAAKSYTFNAALDFAITKCKLAPKTILDYSCTTRFFKTAATALKLDKVPIALIKKSQIKSMLDYLTQKRKGSNKAYNKHARYLASVISKLEEYEIIEKNPAHGIKRMAVTESEMYKALTPAEKALIKKEIAPDHPGFFVMIMLIYHTGIRPKEALSLRLEDIFLDQDVIMINPSMEEGNSKTKSIRTVAINPYLKELLQAHMGDSNSQCYLFGKPAKGGYYVSPTGRVYGSARKDYFLPSPVRVKRDTATKLWHKLVIVGLEINKYMYGMKHTGADDKIMAGVPLDALKELYGHKSKYMTEVYAKKIKSVYRQQVIEKSPDFV